MASRVGEKSGTERASEMHQMYADGATLEEVGRRYGMTRERVRQVFRAAGLPNISLADRRRREIQRRTDEILRAFDELKDLRAVAKSLDMPIAVVEEVLRRELPAGRLRKPTKHGKKYSDEELVWMLREVSSELGGVLSKDAFEACARGRRLQDGRPWPTAQTHMLRFGSWRRSLEAAGLRANPSSPISGQVLFDEPQCIDAIRHVGRVLGKVPTVAEYEECATRSNGGLPSSATIRNRCGRWYEALGKAGL